ncbi:MAG: SAM-dependent methyltransferase [Pseudomonadota bacterium]|nr:SAM-dependent methyltransferase [Pseudomonadota bacterium]
MSKLLNHIKSRILAEGPLSVADYMDEALFNPEYGYYMVGDPLGKKGDFVTAPEISQMFGELIGLWCLDIWKKMGSPVKINLVELGPGRGTLLVDSLRAISNFQPFISAINIHIVETSPNLIKRQKRNLKALGYDIEWHDNFQDVPKGPLIIIANELFDVLPIRQFVKSANGWVERRVGCNGLGELAWVSDQSRLISRNLVPPNLARTKLGSIFELTQSGIDLISNITKSIVKFGGAALVIDYGHIKSAVGDTLQAVKNHSYSNILGDPGKADISAHVDFECLAKKAIAMGGVICGPVTQRDFLLSLGIEVRATQLKNFASTRQKSDVLMGLNRLIGADEMGNLFKVMAVIHPDQKFPDGFKRKF